MKDKYQIWIYGDVHKKDIKFLFALESPFSDIAKTIYIDRLRFLSANLFTSLMISYKLNGKKRRNNEGSKTLSS